MVIKTRSELKKSFSDNAVPLPTDFFNLIDSALLKADDQFFGKWRAGYAYKPGDVVLYVDKLYTFSGISSNMTDKDCDCGGGNQPPGDKGCWDELRIDMNDHDWEIVRNDKKEPLYMYAAVHGKIGIGTKKEESPKAFLHLNDDITGGGSQFLFNPIGEKNDEPMFKMKKTKQITKSEGDQTYNKKADFVAQSLGKQYVRNVTNTLGYLFKRLYQPENEAPTEGVLLFITAHEKQANIGVGTKSPEGMLDIQDGSEKRVLLNPNNKQEPEMILINLDESNMHNYLAHSVSSRFALLTTNAERGFMFRKGIDYTNFVNKKNNDETGTSVMVIDTQSGNIGIGTETPTMRLQVEGKAGKVQVNLDELNPSINIIDRPLGKKHESSPPIYLAMGAADDVSVLSTNAKKGFVFKRGTDMTTVNDKIKLGDSNGILKLYPQDFENSQYNALLDGYAVAKGFYVRPAPYKVNGKWTPLTNSLATLSKLSPVEFQYDERPDETHYGFEIEDMVNNVIDATLQLPNDAKVIAYQNLVTMLVSAVKELNTNVENLTRRVHDLEIR